MDFGPYLSERNTGCYNQTPMPPAAPCPGSAEQHDPSCDKNPASCCTSGDSKQSYLGMRKERWNVLRVDTCKPLGVQLYNACGDPAAKSALETQYRARPEICALPEWTKHESQYKKDFQFPKSHNAVDDCCRAPCPCPDKFPELASNVSFLCTERPAPCAPLDDMTTYNYFYTPHVVGPRYRHPAGRYDPCECPFEECTITKSDYTKKDPIPNGPACAQISRHGLWSTAQMCKEFTDCTTTVEEYPEKCSEKRWPYLPCHNLRVSRCPMRDNDSITRTDYPAKTGVDPPYPEWLENDSFYRPETEMERCTTYKHFYRPYELPAPLQTAQVGSPNAIPFCTLNKLCYSCHDPKPNQKTPVEMRDNDPWPYVVREPIRYQNNLHVDPCADFCDVTIYKSNYTPKSLCKRTASFRPIRGYVEPTIPFNDNTTNRVSYRAYNQCEYDSAIGNAGNPNGVKWGPFYYKENVDKCQPRFPAPYGHPLKPFIDPCGKCPCGPFDNRSTYNQDFRFRSPEVVAEMVADRCQEPNVSKGVSLSRFDYVEQAGKRAAVMSPPTSKGYRCIHPCNINSTDTLYRLDYHDFWKTMERPHLELYRGKPTIRTRRQPEPAPPEEEIEDGGDILMFQPICMKKHGEKCTSLEEARECQQEKESGRSSPSATGAITINFQSPDHQRCRQIPYSGQDILNRPPQGVSHIANGYK